MYNFGLAAMGAFATVVWMLSDISSDIKNLGDKTGHLEKSLKNLGDTIDHIYGEEPGRQDWPPQRQALDDADCGVYAVLLCV